MEPDKKIMAVVDLEEMEFFARHGCYDLEKTVGGRFAVNISYAYDATDAAREDDVRKSVNYLEVYETAREEMERPSDTLENVAARIAGRLKKTFPAMGKLTVRVSKIAPPLGGKTARVTVTVTL